MAQMEARYEGIDRNATLAFGWLVVSAKQRGHRESDRRTRPG
jgi:hypothetical protein